MDTLTPASGLEYQLVYDAEKSRTPISGAFELLSACNLNCSFCYLKQSHKTCTTSYLPVSFWLRIAEELKEMGTLFLLLTGGEPFLYPEFKELYLRLQEMGFILTLNTNGTMITAERADFLSHHMPRRVNVTLYGTSPETYQKVTGNAGGYERAVSGIRHLLAAGIPVKMNVSLVPDNREELPEFYRIANELNIPIEVNSYLYPATREPEYEYASGVRLAPLDAAKADLENDYYRYTPDAFQKKCQDMALCYRNRDCSVSSGSRVIMPCRAAGSSFWINWKGELTPCVFLAEGKVSLQDTSFAAGWDLLSQVREGICLPDKCSSCAMRRFCLICCAAVYHENHNFDQAPEYLCQMTEEKLRLAYKLIAGEGLSK